MAENVIEEAHRRANETEVQSEQTAEGSEEGTATAADGKADDEKEQGQPPKKKSKKNPVKKAGNAESASASQDKYPFARSRGIRIFSDREIESQDAEMTKEYWRFWNDTAEELCSDRAYNDWGKRDLKLYIDAAWIIHKTYLQELRERELAGLLKELQEKYGYVELPAKLKSQDQAVSSALSKVRKDISGTQVQKVAQFYRRRLQGVSERSKRLQTQSLQLQDSTANLNELNLELSRTRGKAMNLKQRAVSDSFPAKQKDEETRVMNKQISELEKTLYEGMSEVKRDQDSMKKALNRHKTLVYKARQERPLVGHS